MENYKINHELSQYDYSEGIEFKGLLPELMDAEGVKTIGATDETKSIKHFGFEAKGSDALEVVDVEGLYDEE